jgi:lipopolysaccharide export system protein LptA
MKFSPAGQWTEFEQSGKVCFREGERSAQSGRCFREGERGAQADHARMVRATDTLTLTGSATVADSVSRTSAPAITFQQGFGDIRADGGVSTSYYSVQKNSATNFAPQPAHLSAEKLMANRDSGRAVYSGHARLWQGDAVIEAASISLFRDEQRLEASENVMALLPQESGPAPAERGSAKANAPAGRNIWKARAARMTYWGNESKVRMEGGVSAQSNIGQIRSKDLELYLTSANNGPKLLSKAIATGGVIVLQGDRRGTAERADYVASDGKFILSGGKPMLYDSVFGTTTGRQLTFFLADDRILVDSEEGSRTLSRHRVD